MLVTIASHYQKSPIAPHDFFDLRNAMVPVFMLLIPCDVDASTSSVT